MGLLQGLAMNIHNLTFYPNPAGQINDVSLLGSSTPGHKKRNPTWNGHKNHEKGSVIFIISAFSNTKPLLSLFNFEGEEPVQEQRLRSTEAKRREGIMKLELHCKRSCPKKQKLSTRVIWARFCCWRSTWG